MEVEANAFIGADQDEIKENLHSKDENVVLASLDAVRDNDVSYYLDDIANILVRFPKQLIRSFALLLLVNKQVNKEFSFNHLGQIIKVNPAKLLPPFTGDKFNSLVKSMGEEYKDPSISENAVMLLSSFLIYIYPMEVDFSDPHLLEALYELSASYLHVDIGDIDDRLFRRKLDKEKVNQFIDQIRTANEAD